MNSQRERCESIVDGLRAWYEHTDAAPPTPAEVEQTIMLAGDRELTAADWTAIFKLGSRRLSIVLGVLMNHLDAPTDDEQVTDALRMLSPAAPSPVKRIRPLANGKPAQPPRA